MRGCRTILAFVTSRKLRITVLGLNYAPEPSGNAPYTASLAEGLAAAGHTVHVLTGFPHYPEWTLKEGYSGWKMKEVINGVSVQRLRHFVPRNPTALSRMHMELSFGARLVTARWRNPDVVLVVSPALLSSGLSIMRLRVRRNRPAVAIWVQDLYSRGVVETGTGGNLLARFASFLESKILCSADGVAAIHERFKHHMVSVLGVPPERVEVIRNWTHLPPTPVSGVSGIRTELGWGPEEVVVLHAGNMGKKQGLENVVDAARIASDQGSPVRFVLMGDGNQRRHLENLSRGIPRISFLDSLPGNEFQLALAAADVLLVNELPGLRDMAVPSKLTSYFNAGVPVIAATDQNSVTASEIENCKGGVRVDPADPGALLETAAALARDPALCAEIASNALRFRRETLSESAAIAHYDEFITSLASSRGR